MRWWKVFGLAGVVGVLAPGELWGRTTDQEEWRVLDPSLVPRLSVSVDASD